MFNLNWKITIGKYRLNVVDSVEIKRSVEQLVDTAVVKLPGAVYNAPLQIDGKLKEGDKVEIRLGCGNQVKEFEGYLASISIDDNGITLTCEDAISMFRVPIPDIELKAPTVDKILQYVVAEVSNQKGVPFTVSCSYSFGYDKFVIRNYTGLDILKKLHDEVKPNIYLKDDVLHVHPQYTETFGQAVYNFSTNIESDQLSYKDANDRKYMVEAQGTGADGKEVKVEEGVSGGDKMTLNIPGVSDPESLRKLAKEALAHKVYTGYEGSFDAWLVPYCDAGYKVSIKDDDREYESGNYYVTSVDVSFSKSGGKRTITIGKKLK